MGCLGRLFPGGGGYSCMQHNPPPPTHTTALCQSPPPPFVLPHPREDGPLPPHTWHSDESSSVPGAVLRPKVCTEHCNEASYDANALH